MKLGFHLPQWGAAAQRDGVLAVARTVEEAGLDSLWVADHVVHPLGSGSAYPYADDPPFGPDDGFLEAPTVLAAVAAVTERVALGTSVLVLPMRETLLTAKVLATLDVLAGGRTVVAAGAGWWQEEFDALGATFRRRGDRFDEQLGALRELWTTGVARADGEHVRFPEVVCKPRPPRPGGIPLLVGGMGPRALRRAGTLGDGWHAVGVHAETLTSGMDAVRRHAQAAGRDPAALTLSTSTVLPDDDERALRRLVRLGGAGVDHVILDARDPDAAAMCRTITRFAEQLLPRLRTELGR